VEGSDSALVFIADSGSWPYALGLTGLALAAIFTAPVRLRFQSNPNTWAGILMIAGLGTLSIWSATPLALVLTWTVVDMVEAAFLVRSATEKTLTRRGRSQSVVVFAIRLLGTMLVVWGMVVSRGRGGGAMTLANVQPDVGVYLLLAAALRLGVLPLYLTQAMGTRFRRGLGTMVRVTAPAVSLVLLSRLPPEVVPPSLATILLVFTTLAAGYGGLFWLLQENEIRGRPYWVLALAGLALASAIRGQPAAALIWGSLMVVNGGMLFLHTMRWRVMRVVFILPLVAMSGLPFSPAAAGWAGLVVQPFTLLDVLSILVHSFLVAGLIRHAWRSDPVDTTVARWSYATYPLGMFILALTPWLMSITGWGSGWNLGPWWAALASLLLACLWWWMMMSIQRFSESFKTVPQGIRQGFGRVGNVVTVILRLEWLYSLTGLIYRGIGGMVSALTAIFEGEGGVLWAVLLLTLLITLLQTGNVP
jgi:hypothetical protein